MNSIENINGVKTPLAYQLTEYDCAQATFLNAMRFLLNRNEIPPVMIKYITLMIIAVKPLMSVADCLNTALIEI